MKCKQCGEPIEYYRSPGDDPEANNAYWKHDTDNYVELDHDHVATPEVDEE